MSCSPSLYRPMSSHFVSTSRPTRTNCSRNNKASNTAKVSPKGILKKRGSSNLSAKTRRAATTTGWAMIARPCTVAQSTGQEFGPKESVLSSSVWPRMKLPKEENMESEEAAMAMDRHAARGDAALFPVKLRLHCGSCSGPAHASRHCSTLAWLGNHRSLGSASMSESCKQTAESSAARTWRPGPSAMSMASQTRMFTRLTMTCCRSSSLTFGEISVAPAMSEAHVAASPPALPACKVERIRNSLPTPSSCCHAAAA
mmetsp:Transcript_22973/g.40550  ORF Transcript_22973/g.40550 Transcript_22973/m.40550 type:complete len:257 (-) Transcript_22973:2593-3363(-)